MKEAFLCYDQQVTQKEIRDILQKNMKDEGNSKNMEFN